jgi:hypothetical protein
MLHINGTKLGNGNIVVNSVHVTYGAALARSGKLGGSAFPVVYGPFGGRKPRKGDVLALSREASGFVAVAPR